MIVGLMQVLPLLPTGSEQPETGPSSPGREGAPLNLIDAALTLAAALKPQPDAQGNPVLSAYDASRPELQPVIDYWKTAYCGGRLDQPLCQDAQSGSLQCAAFVRGVLFLAGHPIEAVGHGVDYYDSPRAYEVLAEWEQLPPGSLPQPGDLASWEYGEWGHVAMVVDVRPPREGQEGQVVFAHSNFVGNAPHPYLSEGMTRTLYQLPLQADLSLSSWPGATLQGYRRPPAAWTLPAQEDLDQIDSSLLQRVPAQWHDYVPVAAQYARTYEVPVRYFTRQVFEASGYDPQAGSATGGSGIAGVTALTASQQIARYGNGGALCHDGSTGDARDRSLWPCVDAALDGQARLMKTLMEQYLLPAWGFSPTGAYAIALVATFDPATAETTARCLTRQDVHDPRPHQVAGCVPGGLAAPRDAIRLIVQ